MTKNEKTVTVKITRQQLRLLMYACSWLTGEWIMNGKDPAVWTALRERLQEILIAHDKRRETE